MKTTIATNSISDDDFIQSPQFEISVIAEYIDRQSNPDENRFVFAYHVKIINKGNSSAQLLRRHWIITDAHGETLEVKGDGVIGKQPWIAAGEEYNYSSGTVLNEFMGCMQGSYLMCGEDGVEFKITIPVFTLAQPDKLH